MSCYSFATPELLPEAIVMEFNSHLAMVTARCMTDVNRKVIEHGARNT